MTKTVTAKEFVDAIRANGLPKIRTYYFEYKSFDSNISTTVKSNLYQPSREIVGACGVGQACITLKIDPNKHLRGATELITQAIQWNDKTEWSFSELADWLETQEWYHPDEQMVFND